MDLQHISTLDKTLALVTVFVEHNHIPANELPSFIQSVHSAIVGLQSHDADANQTSPVNDEGHRSPLSSSLPIELLATHDHIVCLEDGKRLMMLKRYL